VGVNHLVLSNQFTQSLVDFLNTEMDLAITFAGLARTRAEAGHAGEAKKVKQNALAAIASVRQFFDRLPDHEKPAIEKRRAEVQLIVSAL
jgi:hypothetical protein